jgi:VCBS repeat-containing protein
MPAREALERVRVVIADRRPIVLQGFASMFAAQANFEVVASCLDGASCLEAIRNLAPDVALVEDGFHDVTALEMLAAVNAEELPTRLVLYTASIARGDLAAAVAAGACSCVSMRDSPEILMQSLRLEARRPHRAAAGKDEGEAVREDVLALLTDQERRIIGLVAQGLSTKEVARRLDVSPGAIRVSLDYLFQKLGIKNRTQLAALALSQRYGGIGVLAALIFAALDGDHDAASAGVIDGGHAVSDTFTVMAANGNREVITVTVNGPREPAGASGTTAKALIKARAAANGTTGTSMSAGKPFDAGGDSTASTTGWAAFNLARPSPGSFGTFMTVAAAIWIYVLDFIHSAAQAFDIRDSLPDAFTSVAASGTGELVTHPIAGSAGMNLDGSNVAVMDPGIHDRPFAVGTASVDTVARVGDHLPIFDADAVQNSAGGNAKDNNPHSGSGSITALVDHGGEAIAASASTQAEHGTAQASGGDDSSHGQSQRDLHAAEDGSAAAEPQAGQEPPAKDSNHEQSQLELHAAEDGSAAAEPQAGQEPPGHDSNHGQSQRDLHAAEDDSAATKPHAGQDPQGYDSHHGQSQHDLHTAEAGSAAAEPHAGQDPPGHDSSHGQSQRDLHAAEDGSAAARHDASTESEAHRGQSQHDVHAVPVNAAGSLHSGSSPHAASNDQPADDAGRAETAAAPALGDSFHFKKDMGAPKVSDVFERPAGDGSDLIEHSLHMAGHDVLAWIQEADLAGLSLAEQNPGHAQGTVHHLAHDLIV